MLHRYESDETPMVSYLNVHSALEQRRRASREASTSDRPGPRAMVSHLPCRPGVHAFRTDFNAG